MGPQADEILLAVVHEESERSVLFGGEDDESGPLGVRWFNAPHICLLLELLLFEQSCLWASPVRSRVDQTDLR